MNAVDARRSEVSSAEAARDDVCDLGRWLRSPEVPEKARASEGFGRIMDLHREFHQCAGRVLGHVEAGRWTEARRLLAHGDCYDTASLALVSALMSWRW